MFIKYMFIISALILALMLLFYKINLQKKPRTEQTARYVSVLTFSFALYIVAAFILTVFTKGIFSKIIMFVFAMSPFIIGKFADYKHEFVYSYIQIFCAIISAGYVYWI